MAQAKGRGTVTRQPPSTEETAMVPEELPAESADASLCEAETAGNDGNYDEDEGEEEEDVDPDFEC